MIELIHRVLIVPAAFQALAQGLCEAMARLGIKLIEGEAS